MTGSFVMAKEDVFTAACAHVAVVSVLLEVGEVQRAASVGALQHASRAQIAGTTTQTAMPYIECVLETNVQEINLTGVQAREWARSVQETAQHRFMLPR